MPDDLEKIRQRIANREKVEDTPRQKLGLGNLERYDSIAKMENTKKTIEQTPSFLEGTQRILDQAPTLMGLDVGSIFKGVTEGIKGAIDTFGKST